MAKGIVAVARKAASLHRHHANVGTLCQTGGHGGRTIVQAGGSPVALPRHHIAHVGTGRLQHGGNAMDAVAAGGNEDVKRGVVHYGRGGREKGGEIRDRRDRANAAVFLSQNENAAARRIPDRGGSAGCTVMSGQWGRATGWQCLTTCAACSVCPRRGGAS